METIFSKILNFFGLIAGIVAFFALLLGIRSYYITRKQYKEQRIKKFLDAGQRNEEQGNLRNALSEYRKAMQISPKDTTVLASFVRILYNVASSYNEYKEAEKYSLLLTTLAPQDTTGWFHRGKILSKMDRWFDAFGAFQEAIKQDLYNADAHVELGIYYSDESKPPDLQKAIGHFLMAFSLKPELENQFDDNKIEVIKIRLNPKKIGASKGLRADVVFSS